MLVITRRANDAIVIDTGTELIEVTVMEIGRQVRIGIAAPESCRIWRKELYTTIQENKQASTAITAENLLGIAQKLKQGKPLE